MPPMRLGSVALLILLAVSTYSCSRSVGATSKLTAPTTVNIDKPRIDFATQIEPILKAKCQSCHFKGGKVYDKLPFDRPETIKTLGTKLFTRIQDEKERSLIREFLDQP